MSISTVTLIVAFFTFMIHLTEALSYCMRYAGLKTKQIAISMSFVTSTLLVSRLSNMFQAPLLGNMVDSAVMTGSAEALQQLQLDFRFVIFAASIGTFTGILLTPTFINIFKKAIRNFLVIGSLPKMVFMLFYPKKALSIIKCIELPKWNTIKNVNFANIPKTFIIMNMLVTSIYTIGVLCSLFAGANLPQLRATAVQLSGIVNGFATILLTIIVDPEGARITDQAAHQVRPQGDVKTVVISLLLSKLIGTLIIAQLLFLPASEYIMHVARLIEKFF